MIERNPTEWHLAFRPTTAWYSRCLAPGFGHVSALTYQAGRWVYFDPAWDFLHVEVIDAPDALPEDIIDAHTIVHVTSLRRAGRYRAPHMFGPLTCVEAVKSLLGIAKAGIWTPHQLYRYCCARNYRLED